MQGLLWARCRPRAASVKWIGLRFRGTKASKKPNTGHPHRSQQVASHSPPDNFPALTGVTVPATTVLAFFKSNVGSWISRRAVRDRLVSFGAPGKDVTKLLAAFARSAQSGFFDAPEAMEKYQLMKLRGSDPVDADITFSNIFFRWLVTQRSVPGVDPAATAALLRITEAATHMHPAEEYERARRMRRKFIMHVGPTNSGKTHHALRALAAAERGVYAGPLRLLAYEIWERMNLGLIVPLGATEEQIAEAARIGPSVDNPFARTCNMITGEEQKIVETNGGVITSCTIEMLQVGAESDVAVIDEIQMIGDRERGFGWTRAVLGICAAEVHLCGEETAVPIVKELLKDTDDEIIVKRYERLTPLEIEEKSLESLSRIRKGDCIVAFSRTAIFSLKKEVEKQTGMKCAVVYGRLPPEVRSEQAALFNDPESGYDVLIGSDAIGMGLNLKIRRVIFEAVSKWDGGWVSLSVSQAKQIAGRAGRFGMHDADEKPGGFVTTLKAEDLPVLRKLLQQKVPGLAYARIGHSKYNLAQVASNLPANSSTESMYLANLHAGQIPAHCRTVCPTQLSTICAYLDEQGHFTQSDRYLFLEAPFPWRDKLALDAITQFVSSYYQDMHVKIIDTLQKFGYTARLDRAELAMAKAEQDQESQAALPRGKRDYDHSWELNGLETLHKILVAYMWLSFRNPVSYPTQEPVADLKERVERVLHWCLSEITRFDDANPRYTKARRVPIEFKTKRQLENEQLAAKVVA
ncbi:P-loop containing nucleoside triphosphate hydrolase protein [Mycena polygramma]|nr:P-loop containing nucleoside triphosphate hydrolase protein [Mycena polygramma]